MGRAIRYPAVINEAGNDNYYGFRNVIVMLHGKIISEDGFFHQTNTFFVTMCANALDNAVIIARILGQETHTYAHCFRYPRARL